MSTPAIHIKKLISAGLLLVLFSVFFTPAGYFARADGGCHVQQTPYYTEYYGDLTLDGQSAPAGTLVEAYNGDGVQTGCFQVEIPGTLGYMRVYGADAQTGTPGMGYNEQVLFKLGGGDATSNPTPILWTGDRNQHHITLTATSPPPAVADLAPQITASGVQLGWSDVGNSVTYYEVWRSSKPYFNPGDPGATQLEANVPANPGGGVSYTDDGAHQGNAAINDYYLTLSVRADGQKSAASNRAGVFDFALTPGN